MWKTNRWRTKIYNPNICCTSPSCSRTIFNVC
uniref:Uncharacterized protein n=1 Tax=Podoviridae sp. ctsNK10 TaxID=2826582 RepID=A0A8S5NLR2_9CAUD|nr:MAG TPA: hypothetical protein [Podoviridae sp. ctsNK10]DAJ73267.1 MAG TPA: hypothetical protein [Caudoviricetes sp.]